MSGGQVKRESSRCGAGRPPPGRAGRGTGGEDYGTFGKVVKTSATTLSMRAWSGALLLGARW